MDSLFKTNFSNVITPTNQEKVIVDGHEITGTKVVTDEFTGEKEVISEGLGYVLSEQRPLILRLRNIKGRDYLELIFEKREFNISVGDKVSILLRTDKILNFEIVNEPIKQQGDEYSTLTPITVYALEKMSTPRLVKLRIENRDTGIKNIYSIKQIPKGLSSKEPEALLSNPHLPRPIILAQLTIRAYILLVMTKLDNYQPLYLKEDYKEEIIVNDDECYVYLMKDVANGYHKIGISNKPGYRERTLQSEKPTIEMISNKKYPNRKIAASIEQALHLTYAEKRIRGEWFDLDNLEVENLKKSLA